jgi:putative ABC transport system permease protein
VRLNEADGGPRGGLQRALVRALPNVSAIDVRDIIATIRDVVENVSIGVTAVGIVTLVGGILILVGAVAMTKFQKIYETAIYRTLGASTRRMVAMLAIEYGLLGSLAGTLGAVGGALLSWGLATQLFNIDWTPVPGQMAAGIVLAAGIVSFVGVVSSYDVLRRKPLSILRSE